MKKPNTPLDETERLETLRALDVLDTAPEERFDRLTRMAKRLFNVPFALVSLVDENRQWFKSCIGLEATETSRDISFCGHAILGDDIFVIPNALEDARFKDNPLVTGDPHIRFYVGCPLKAHNGQKIGTLCIIDQEPRTFIQEDLDDLRDLATMVEREFSVTHLATMDDLTDISNRRGFLSLSKLTLEMCHRENIPATLIFMDLDNFKPINDQYGHAEGDCLLVTFAQTMKNTFRESDVLARIGGDEFVALLPNLSEDAAKLAVTRLRDAITQRHRQNQCGFDISFSYGLVEYSLTTITSLDDLMKEADKRMYENKQSQRITH